MATSRQYVRLSMKNAVYNTAQSTSGRDNMIRRVGREALLLVVLLILKISSQDISKNCGIII